MPMHEEQFIKRLGAAPELPQEIFCSVIRSIHRGAVIRRAVISTCAIALLCMVGSALAIRQRQATQQERFELAQELEGLQSFVNGDNIEQEYAQYALVDFHEL